MKTFKTVSEVIDYAIRKESESFTFYNDLAQMISKPSLRRMLEGFAVEELQHRIRLEAVKSGEYSLTDTEDPGSLNIAETVPEVELSADMSYQDLLHLAMKRELIAYRVYLSLEMATQDAELKAIFQGLAREEAEHKLRLEIEYDLSTF